MVLKRSAGWLVVCAQRYPTCRTGYKSERLDTSANGTWRTPSPPFGTREGSAHTNEGFTGHEALAGLDTVHMTRIAGAIPNDRRSARRARALDGPSNGRLYWIAGMRMFQPDPIVTQPLNPQNWNPYSYVINNPLNLTDPSGYSFIGKYWRTIAAVVVTVYSGGAAAGYFGGSFLGMTGASAAISGGFVAGAIQTDSLRGGVIGAFSAGVFYGIGSGFQSLAKNSSYAAGTLRAGRIMAHSMAGGAMNSLQGGKFGHGFASAGATQAFGPGIERIDVSTAGFSAQRTLAAAALGGSVSAMTGARAEAYAGR